MAERTRKLAPGIVETVDTGMENDGAMPAVILPGGNARSTRPSDKALAAHGLRFDKVKGTYVNADDGRPANVSPELYKKLFGVSHKTAPLILPPR